MTRIQKAFSKDKAFIGFLTGGDPSIEKTAEFILEMERAGADIIEIGIPFSDPVAEGEVIQNASIRALNAGATVPKMFDLAKSVREKSQIPLVFMTYLNPVYHYGQGRTVRYDEFFKKCKEAEIDGIIIPDLPFEESGEVREYAERHGIDLILLVAPTSEERIGKIAKASSGFVYVVSSMGTTGVREEIKTNIEPIIKAVKTASDIPAAVGFGVSTPEQAARIAKFADGVIVGSAIVRIIAEHGDNAGGYVYEFVKSVKEAVAGTGE
ncbi:MAG: tryptophan synthase subunit alpha [Oscillospiraceae bacterium]|nr:tryptophan synthase subunit alpha [Oscillospiraceae bacterium]